MSGPRHYCDDCTEGVEHDGDDYCCGGDDECDCIRPEPDCTESAHEWTGEGCGGLSENPGVFGRGGTTIAIVRRCSHCGVVRTEVARGAQRNDGECDSLSYAQPEVAP